MKHPYSWYVLMQNNICFPTTCHLFEGLGDINGSSQQKTTQIKTYLWRPLFHSDSLHHHLHVIKHITYWSGIRSILSHSSRDQNVVTSSAHSTLYSYNNSSSGGYHGTKWNFTCGAQSSNKIYFWRLFPDIMTRFLEMIHRTLFWAASWTAAG